MTKIKLWPHQRKAYLRACDTHLLLAHDPGCGKTFVAAALATNSNMPTLYLCPATIRWQVRDAFLEYNPALNVQVLDSGRTALDATANVVIVSYDLASMRPTWEKLVKVAWGVLILDEAHYLKNPRAKRTRAIYGARTNSPGGLWRKAQRVVAMTGTPVLNSPADLWGHYSRLFPDMLRNDEGQTLTYKEWCERFCIIKKGGFGLHIVGAKNLVELKRLLTPYVDRVRKQDVLHDLPALTIDHAPLDAGKLVLPKDIAPEIVATLQDILKTSDWETMEGLAPALATVRRHVGIMKAHALADMIRDELEGGVRKLVVWGLTPDALREIAGRLPEFQPIVIDGSTPQAQRSTLVQEFQDNPFKRVFLGQMYAAGTGTDGLQKAASRCIVAEAAWTPAINDQAIARLHRAGQAEPVHVTFVSLKGSIDEDVTRALVRKAKISETLFGEAKTK